MRKKGAGWGRGAAGVLDGDVRAELEETRRVEQERMRKVGGSEDEDESSESSESKGESVLVDGIVVYTRRFE